jgi:hypothetical protein
MNHVVMAESLPDAFKPTMVEVKVIPALESTLVRFPMGTKRSGLIYGAEDEGEGEDTSYMMCRIILRLSASSRCGDSGDGSGN